MGDITLGCLLGQYGGAQSFDVASTSSPLASGDCGSWEVGGGTHSFQRSATEVHSSLQAWHIHTSSISGTTLLSYNHAYADDLYSRWSPDVSTHFLQCDFWAREWLIADSGCYMDFNDTPGEQNLFIRPNPNGLEAYRNSTPNCTSATGCRVRFIRDYGVNSSEVSIDDVLTQIDLFTLRPTYDAVWQQHVVQGRARTQGGQLYSALWGQYFAYNLPLPFLAGSEANLINWWWQNQFSLCLTLDTSDVGSIRLVRIVNDTQPIGSRVKPYGDRWQGVLQLESLDKGSLVY